MNLTSYGGYHGSWIFSGPWKMKSWKFSPELVGRMSAHYKIEQRRSWPNSFGFQKPKAGTAGGLTGVRDLFGTWTTKTDHSPCALPTWRVKYRQMSNFCNTHHDDTRRNELCRQLASNLRTPDDVGLTPRFWGVREEILLQTPNNNDNGLWLPRPSFQIPGAGWLRHSARPMPSPLRHSLSMCEDFLVEGPLV